MKTILLSTLFALFVAGLSAQDYVVTFQPASGNAAIDSIRATNLTTNISVKITGNETLSLVKGYTAISPLQKSPESGNLYPNPAGNDATLSFLTKTKQEVKLRIYNVSGQLINQTNQMVDPGIQRFSVKFPYAGIYYVSIVKTEGVESLKAVYTGETNQSSRISYTGIEKTLTGENGSIKSVETGKTLSFNLGEIIQYSVFSGKNNTIEMDSPTASKTCVVTFYECIDKDNNSYKVVKIGDQVWMAENLRYLPQVQSNSEYATASLNSQPAFGVYGYDGSDVATAKKQANYTTYGVLYNWYALNTANFCPLGWHVPSDAEWTTLENHLIAKGYNYDGTTTGNKYAKALASTTGWASYPGIGTVGNTDYPLKRNETGFTALPGGYRDELGSVNTIGNFGYWWSSTEPYTASAWFRLMENVYSSVSRASTSKNYGQSVRCVRD